MQLYLSKLNNIKDGSVTTTTNPKTLSKLTFTTSEPGKLTSSSKLTPNIKTNISFLKKSFEQNPPQSKSTTKDKNSNFQAAKEKIGTSSINKKTVNTKQILLTCFICSKEFTGDSVKSHVLSCFEKYNQQSKINEINSDGINHGQERETNIDKVIDLSSKCISSIPSEFQEIILLLD